MTSVHERCLSVAISMSTSTNEGLSFIKRVAAVDYYLKVYFRFSW